MHTYVTYAIPYFVEILSRYPNFDYEDFPLTTEHLPMFCMPVGVSVELWNEHTSFPLPTFSTFVLTSTEAIKMYGATVSFYEELKHHKNMSVIQKHVGVDDKVGCFVPANTVHVCIYPLHTYILCWSMYSKTVRI